MIGRVTAGEFACAPPHMVGGLTSVLLENHGVQPSVSIGWAGCEDAH